MLIREVMKSNPITVSPDIKLSDAYRIILEKGIRHLPVLENGKLIGLITDRDLRLATSKLAKKIFEPDASIKEVMSCPVETTHPAEPIEIAIQRMREFKIGCLPVLDNFILVGIVTVADLLDAMLVLTGVHSPSGRIDIRLTDRAGELARLTKLLAERKVNVHSILSYPEKNKDTVRVVLRISTMEIRTLATAICNADFDVVWPVHISCVK